MGSFINDIKSGSISQVYLFYGEESYKKRYYKEILKDSVLNGNNMNLSSFEGKNIDWQAVYDAVNTMPFFSDRRLVIIENSGKFKAKQENDSDSDKGSDLIEKIITQSPETTCLAFFEESAAKNKRIFKQIASKGSVIECNADTEEDIINWLARGFAREGKKVRRSTLSLLTARTGLNYDLLRMEFEKIVSYAYDRDIIEDSDINAVVSENIESRIFDLLGAVSEKNIPEVLKKYNDLLENKEHPLYIMAMIRSQIRTMLQICELNEKHLNAFEISKAAGKPQFVVKKTIGYLRYFSKDQLIRMLDKINETDRKSKKGLISDQIGVEMLLIEFSR